jgi:hypothetical protein
MQAGVVARTLADLSVSFTICNSQGDEGCSFFSVEHGKVGHLDLRARSFVLSATNFLLPTRNPQVTIEKDGKNLATIDAGEIVGLQALQVFDARLLLFYSQDLIFLFLFQYQRPRTASVISASSPCIVRRPRPDIPLLTIATAARFLLLTSAVPQVCAVSPTWEQIQVIHAEVVSRDAPAAQAALVRPSNSLASAEDYTRKLRSPTLAHAAEDSRKFIYISCTMFNLTIEQLRFRRHRSGFNN